MLYKNEFKMKKLLDNIFIHVILEHEFWICWIKFSY